MPGRGGGRPPAAGVVLAVRPGELPGEGVDLAVEVVEALAGGGALGQGAADRGDQAGQPGDLVAELVVVGGLAGVDGGDGLTARGELVQGRAQRVGGHGRSQGNDGPFEMTGFGQPGAGGTGPSSGPAGNLWFSSGTGHGPRRGGRPGPVSGRSPWACPGQGPA